MSAAPTFEFGVASGDVGQDRVTLWTHVASRSSAQPVSWWIAPASDGSDSPADPDGEPQAVVSSGTTLADPADGGTIHVEVSGLRPGTSYRYGFRADRDTITGRTKTLPAHADRIRFVVACCSRFGWPGFEQYGAIAAEAPDFVLHLGDYLYETGGPTPTGVTLEPPDDCRQLDDYRSRYRQHRRHLGLQRLHGSVPFLAYWDDHEVANGAPGDEGVARRLAGQRAWHEWMPMQRSADFAPIDRTVRIAGLLDLAMIDTRFGGRRPAPTNGPSTSAASGPMLQDQQWLRIEQTVADAESPWLVIASQVQVGPMTLAAVPARRVPPWRRLVNPDQWDGYPGERLRLYELLAQASPRSVVLSGDLHSGWSRSLRHRGATIAHEFTSPSISGETYGASFRARTRLPTVALRLALRMFNRGIDLLELDRHGYLVCEVTPQRFSTTFVLGPAGDEARIERSVEARERRAVGGPWRSVGGVGRLNRER